MPVFNERRTIEEAVNRILSLEFLHELIVVDDASTDGTSRILAEVSDPRVTLVRHERNRGKGAALRSGFRQVSGDLVAIQDADLEYDPSELERLMAPIVEGQADVVFGTRFSSTQTRRVLFFWHSVGNHVLTTASNAMTNLNLTDMETGYKVFTRAVLDSMCVEEDRFGFEPEFTTKVASNGFRIYEIGISYFGRGYSEGKKIGWRDGVEAVRCLVKYSVRERRRSKRALMIAAAQDHPSLSPSLHELSDAHNYYTWIASHIEPATSGRVLELGAGRGTFTEFLARSAESVDAVEPSATEFERLQQNMIAFPNVTAIHGTLEDLAVGAVPEYDNAVLINVLEHIQDDLGTLRELRSRVRPGGFIALWVPAHEVLYSRFDFAVGHFRRYSRSELKALALSAGLEISRLTYVNALGAVAWGAVATLGRQAPTAGRRAEIWDKRVVPVVSALESRVSVPWGQSLLLLARVPLHNSGS